MNPRYLLAAVLLGATPTYAQPAPSHPIDKALEACLDKAASTADQSQCGYRAYEKWDQELNRAYGALAAALEPEGKQRLKAAQQAWLKHRDAEFKLIDAVYAGLEGTMYQPMRVESRTRTVRERALVLGSYLELVKGQ